MNRLGDWYAFCDICGNKYLASELHIPPHQKNLKVCKRDLDKRDPGLLPFNPRKEQIRQLIRINHTNTESSTPEIDLESMTYVYCLAASQDNYTLTLSQDSETALIINEPIP